MVHGADPGGLDDWDAVRERARVVHLLAARGASYRELARVAERDMAVLVAAIAFESEDRRDYVLLSRETVRYRLHGLLDELCAHAA